ncbi:MAG: DUF6261 family protein [Bacteroidales bacterium]|jgi:hypothetical protein|nr:DUF6261 family protein [Bacteroidales bacterium]
MKKLFSYIVGIFRQLNNETHVLLNDEVRRAIIKYNIRSEALDRLLEKHLEVLNAEKSALDIMVASAFTKDIRDQDKIRDKILRGFLYAVRSALFHVDPIRVKWAQIINTVLRNYGNISAKSFDAETAAIDDLIRILNEGKNLDAVRGLGLEDWLKNLQIANDDFKNLMHERYDEKSHLPIIRMRQARRESDSLIHLIFSQIEILIFTQGEDNYQPFIKEINLIMDRFKAILAQQAGVRKKEKEKNKEITDEINNENTKENEITNE